MTIGRSGNCLKREVEFLYIIGRMRVIKLFSDEIQ